MSKSHARFAAFPIVRPAEPPRVRQLEANDQVVRAAISLAMRLDQGLAQLREAGPVLFVNDELVRIGAPFGDHGHGLPAPDQLRAAFTEAPPASQHGLGHAPAGGAVPAFHRLNGPAISDEPAIKNQAVPQCGGLARQHLRLELQVQVEALRVLAKGLDGLERRNSG